MSLSSRREYIAVLRKRYLSASRQERSKILDEVVANTGMHRKSAIRCLKKGLRPCSRAGRKRVYRAETISVLKKIWIASDQLCSKKLKQAIPAWLSRFQQQIPLWVASELTQISPASIDRYLKPYRAQERRRSHTKTKAGHPSLKRLVPLKGLSNVPSCAGHLEADTVSHCGGFVKGDYIWSLTVTDTCSGWTENRAVWGRTSKSVLEAIQSIEEGLPFSILSINCDNGTEFLNQRFIEYFQKGGQKNRDRFVMTRSRSYRKNDNAHVEQKNWTSVRQLFDYERLEFRELIPLMNEIYRIQNLFSNFWIPQFKLKSKVRVGAKIKKTYHPPQTPYERLIQDPAVTEESKERLKAIYRTLNPFTLREQRDALITQFQKLKAKLQSAKNPESTDLSSPELPAGNPF